MNRIKRGVLAALVASAVTVPQGLAFAEDHHHDRDDRRAYRELRQDEARLARERQLEQQRLVQQRLEQERLQRERRQYQAAAREYRQDQRRLNAQQRWDAARYYRYNPTQYRERRLGLNDSIYRGYDDRYYCRHGDGTTGLIIGGVGGGVLGNIIAPGDSKTLGTLIGAGGGALLGRAIDKNHVTCR